MYTGTPNVVIGSMATQGLASPRLALCAATPMQPGSPPDRRRAPTDPARIRLSKLKRTTRRGQTGLGAWLGGRRLTPRPGGLPVPEQAAQDWNAHSNNDAHLLPDVGQNREHDACKCTTIKLRIYTCSTSSPAADVKGIQESAIQEPCQYQLGNGMTSQA